MFAVIWRGRQRRTDDGRVEYGRNEHGRAESGRNVRGNWRIHRGRTEVGQAERAKCRVWVDENKDLSSAKLSVARMCKGMGGSADEEQRVAKLSVQSAEFG